MAKSKGSSDKTGTSRHDHLESDATDQVKVGEGRVDKTSPTSEVASTPAKKARTSGINHMKTKIGRNKEFEKGDKAKARKKKVRKQLHPVSSSVAASRQAVIDSSKVLSAENEYIDRFFVQENKSEAEDGISSQSKKKKRKGKKEPEKDDNGNNSVGQNKKVTTPTRKHRKESQTVASSVAAARQAVIDSSKVLTEENEYIDRFLVQKQERGAEKIEGVKNRDKAGIKRKVKKEEDATPEGPKPPKSPLPTPSPGKKSGRKNAKKPNHKRHASEPTLATEDKESGSRRPSPSLDTDDTVNPVLPPPPSPSRVDSIDSLDTDFKALNFSSDDSKKSYRPDMTWIRGDNRYSVDEEPTPKAQDADEDHPYAGIRRLLSIVAMCGCLPVAIYPCYEGGFTSFRCRKRALWKRLDFYFLTLLLGMAMVIGCMSLVHILFSEVDKEASVTDREAHYSNFEKLMVQKHWLPVTIFFFTLFLALIGNLTFIFKEEAIINFANEVGESFQELNFDNVQGPWWWWFGLIHGLITALDGIILISLVASDAFGFREGIRFETILYLRWFKTEAFLQDKITLVGVCFMVLLEIYVYFLARNHLLFVMILAKWITQSAHGWNARIAHFLKDEKRKSVVHLSKLLTYEVLLKEHHMLTKMVRSLSHAFPATLCVFFGAKLMGICCQFFRAALTFLFDLEVKNVGQTIEGTKVKYNPTDNEAAFEVVYYLSATVVVLFVTTVTISQVGETVMHGFMPVRRYGLLLASSLKGRKFVMSLFMSFNAKKPHVVKPGLWFSVDKGLFMSILGMSLFLFSIMIQCQISNLVEVPIVLSCPHNPGTLCVGRVSSSRDPKQIHGEHVQRVKNKEFAKIREIPQLALIKASLASTTSTTTTPATPTISTTTTPTISTTLENILPPGTEGFFDPNNPPPNVKLACMVNCRETNEFRMIPFAINGNGVSLKDEMIAGWSDLKNDCLDNPYKFLSSSAKFRDCFKGGPYISEVFHEEAYAAHEDIFEG